MFLKFPVEVLLIILEPLSRTDQLSLARSCQRFYEQIIPMFYVSIETPCYCVDLHKALVNTLLLHPERIDSVRHLKVGKLKFGRKPESYMQHRHEYYESAETKKRLADAVGRLSHRDWEKTQWLEDLEGWSDLNGHQHRDAWLAVLLYLVPNIQTLELFWGGTGTRYSHWVLQRAAQRSKPFDSQPPFPFLHTACIKVTADTGQCFSLARLAPFFQFTSMRTFRGQLMTDGHLIDNMLPVNSSPITHLEIEQSSSETGFIDLIAPCTNLKVFEYTSQDEYLNCSNDYRRLFRHFWPEVFIKAVEKKKDTLEVLSLAPFRHSEYFSHSSAQDWIGPLNGFKALKHLHIHAGCILGNSTSRQDYQNDPVKQRISLDDTLPSSLECLWVYCVSHWASDFRQDKDFAWELMISQLTSLAETTSTRFPCLKKISVEGDFKRSDLPDKDIDKCRAMHPDCSHFMQPEILQLTDSLRSACMEKGIAFHIRDCEIEASLKEFDDLLMFSRFEEDE
ncbi:uncharacterized protein PFLUO_LOCUS241 [Penicillium psychrofluorescens]|uniref:uncharacterized protein n=1 Tax=Penicillium psychrofluorescens TaxID=3158075 RepID=UPI003CCD0E53